MGSKINAPPKPTSANYGIRLLEGNGISRSRSWIIHMLGFNVVYCWILPLEFVFSSFGQTRLYSGSTHIQTSFTSSFEMLKQPHFYQVKYPVSSLASSKWQHTRVPFTIHKSINHPFTIHKLTFYHVTRFPPGLVFLSLRARALLVARGLLLGGALAALWTPRWLGGATAGKNGGIEWWYNQYRLYMGIYIYDYDYMVIYLEKWPLFWLVVWNISFMFPYIVFLNISTDFHVFLRGVAQPPTNEWWNHMWFDEINFELKMIL